MTAAAGALPDSSRDRPILVGLTGGIGSGKSTVAALLAERGAYVVDADQVAREVVSPGSIGLDRLAAEFGPGILRTDGSLDRAALATRAFRDPDSRSRLEAITHPLIQQRTAELFAQAPPGAVRVHEIPLLAELDIASSYDLVVVVDCPDDTRVARLIAKGMSLADARSRMTAQASREARLAVADIVIDNSDGSKRLALQVDALWELLAGADGPSRT